MMGRGSERRVPFDCLGARRKLRWFGSQFRQPYHKVSPYQSALTYVMRESIEQVGANHDTAPVNSGTRQLVLAGIVLRAPRCEREPHTFQITIGTSLGGI